ncbi:uncharacterized protein RHOBADRAFT_54553 [Rhodotorula graminis WP1]|uniref:Uncharacterized protein n=1 Tax=Rhodotorula graminis (strain WP1) TaxID=578459 RepID=A0A0N8Q029_RHOGW|nr:uncharacterized protein RHOBADRAFT_54553 [Rhodotorula graminis WP1]KPV73973.1 hypothetical protein RHOBADRAFT_54553 [Rhodotorula graminis WP1]
MATLPSHKAHHDSPPTQFRSAVFPSPRAPLSLVDVEYRPPSKGRVTLQVDACFLSQNDAIAALGLRHGHDHFPVSPGQAVVGRVVEVGAGAREGGPVTASGMLASVMGKLNLGGGGGGGSATAGDVGGELHRKFKPGETVIASVTHQGLGEYCTAPGVSTCDAVQSMPLLEQCVVAVFGGRVLAVCDRFESDAERKTDDEREALRRMCSTHPVGGGEDKGGCDGAGVVVVWGSGGHASLAYHLLRAVAGPTKHIVIVSPSHHHHTHRDYGVPAGDLLQVGKLGHLDVELRKLGGVELAVCVDQPGSSEGFGELLDAMCPGGEVSLVSIDAGGGKGELELPVGVLLSRSLTVRGLPALQAPTMHRALALCPAHDLHRHVSVRKHAFGVVGVRECWDAVRVPHEGFDAHCVVFGEREGEGVGLGVAA